MAISKRCQITERHGTLLIFDEVKTGSLLGLAEHKPAGVHPDLIAMAKSIGGGSRSGASVAKPIHESHRRRLINTSTYNGNPLVMAVKATLAEACKEIVGATVERNTRLVQACQAIIDSSGIPAHTVRLAPRVASRGQRSP